MYYESGIYKISQISTGKMYVGSSVDIHKRIKAHFSCLKRNTHYNYKIQEAFSSSGEEDFQWEILQRCAIHEMLRVENIWLDRLSAVDEGFNIARKSANTGGVNSKENIKKQVKKTKEAAMVESFIESMRLFTMYKDKTLNEEVNIGFYDLRLGLHIPQRLQKAGNVVNRIMEELYGLPQGHYKIHYVCFIRKEATYRITEVTVKSKFAKKTSNDVYDLMEQEITTYLNSTKLGKKVSVMLEEEGIILKRQDEEKFT